MIEIIVVILLCVTNSKNAKARGKSGGAAVAYTIGLWFGAEILGAIFGMAASGGDESPAIYIAALLFAAGGGVASYFIAKSGTPIAQNQPAFNNSIAAPQNASYPPVTSQNTAYPAQQDTAHYNQQAQPASTAQQGQPLPPAAGQQPVYTAQQDQPLPPPPGQQPVYVEQQTQPQPPQPDQQPLSPMQAPQTQAQVQVGTATINFTAKKVMGQFLVSSATLEVNGVPYQTKFNQPISVQAPAGNVQIECYLNYMGKSGVAQTSVALAPNQTYQLEYKSPMVVTGSGTLTFA